MCEYASFVKVGLVNTKHSNPYDPQPPLQCRRSQRCKFAVLQISQSGIKHSYYCGINPKLAQNLNDVKTAQRGLNATELWLSNWRFLGKIHFWESWFTLHFHINSNLLAHNLVPLFSNWMQHFAWHGDHFELQAGAALEALKISTLTPGCLWPFPSATKWDGWRSQRQHVQGG